MPTTKSPFFKIKEALNSLDWECEDKSYQLTALGTLHWYPASFITSIPGNIVDLFSSAGDVVWDPFCGSGTTSVEAFRKGRTFIGNDISEVAVLITKAKLSLLRHIDEIPSIYGKINFALNFKSDAYEHKEYGKEISSYKDLKDWYHADTLEELTYIWGVINSLEIPKSIRDFFICLFLNIGKVTCAQQKTWGHIADNVRPNKEQITQRKVEVIPLYLKRIEQVIKKAKSIYSVQKLGKYQIKLCDTRTFSPPFKSDLIITSPPYPNMADYITSQRLAFYWLGKTYEDIQLIKTSEVGPRYLRHNSKKLARYLSEMEECFSNIINNMNIDSHLAIMMPSFPPGERNEAVEEFYKYLSSKLTFIHYIERNVDAKSGWSPFRSLKNERLSIWRR